MEQGYERNERGDSSWTLEMKRAWEKIYEMSQCEGGNRRGGDHEIPTRSLWFSSCLPVDRSDPAEDQELHWAPERSTLQQQSPERGSGSCTNSVFAGDMFEQNQLFSHIS